MCGIIGYNGTKESKKVLIEGLKRLEYRGYDSWGIATLTNPNIEVIKRVGKIGNIEADDIKIEDACTGIGHTRWATHGAVNEKNAHPHFGCKKNEIAIVHNGIISNFKELREELKKEGHKFNTECDSEIFGHLFEEKKFKDGMKEVHKRVKGSYAFVVISKFDNGILAARDGSPLVLGIGNNEYFIGSDISAFLEHTNKVVLLDDGEYAIINNGYTIYNKNGEPVKKETKTIDWNLDMIDKGGYKHFMLKEIMEEPLSLKNTLAVPQEDINRMVELINSKSYVYLTGMGTSMHAVITAKYWFALNNKKVICIDSSELEHEAIDNDCLVIGVTQSGETKDTLDALKYAKLGGASTASIVNVVGSSATRKQYADFSILQGSGPEIAVCASKTFLSQLTIFARINETLYKKSWNLNEVPKKIEELLGIREKIKQETEKFCNVDNYFFISRGINYPSAKEAALKFKEISYKHAEAMSAGFLKHGTISLIDKHFKTIAFIPAGITKEKMESNIKEVEARGGEVLKIGFDDDCNIKLPYADERISPFLFATAGQLIAYYYADKLKREIDKPRNLAKSVTVE